jgi:hypothetical protein
MVASAVTVAVDGAVAGTGGVGFGAGHVATGAAAVVQGLQQWCAALLLA